MRTNLLICAAFCAIALVADPPEKPRTIPAEHQAEYWRSQLELRNAQDEVRAAVEAIRRDCAGADARPDPSNPKVLICVDKPGTQ